MKSSLGYTICLAAMLFIVSCKKNTEDIIAPPPPPPTVTMPDNDPLLLGNPTNAQTLTTMPENYLKNNGYYKIAYSQSRAIPVWVAWHLQADQDLGVTPRQDDFRADVGLPAGWYQVQNNSYSGSGFDRGHNCPSADRTSSIPANSSTFLMTNMVPQSPKLNQVSWAGLEDYTRTLVGSTKEAYVFMGNYGVGGYNTNNLYFSSIDGGKITVPANIWKVIVVIPKGANDISRIDTSATVLAVNMPNDNRLYLTGGNTAWRNYITTVSNLEQQSGMNAVMLDLFERIPANIRSYLKLKVYQ
ncbi:MAG: DNA/RNA non-specific endonuclease [Ferruginibacter sp.]